MKINILNERPSGANEFFATIRDRDDQQNRFIFRSYVERLGFLMAYEISKTFSYNDQAVKTPLGTKQVARLSEQPVLITVLRAGLPYFAGFQQFFTHADSGFIGAYRKEGGNEITIKLDYLAAPSLENKTILLIDPMLATGKSFVQSVESMLNHGKPKHIHIAALVAAPEGIDFLEKNLQLSATLWTWAVDEKLNEHAYIVPGLGDAGDLSFGEKL